MKMKEATATENRVARVERKIHRDRIPACRKFAIRVDKNRREVVEVYVARTRKQMREQTRRFRSEQCSKTQGCVVHYTSSTTNTARPVRLYGSVVARMFLNRADLENAPAEIIAHESCHAAMAWVRLQKADLGRMPGEEVLCHATGYMTQQLANIVFKG